MANNELRTYSTRDNIDQSSEPPAYLATINNIERQVSNIFMQVCRIEALVLPARDGITEKMPSFGELFTKDYAGSLDRADTYLGLIEQAAQEITKAGNAIERLGYALCHPERARADAEVI